MATRITPSQNGTYYINPSSITFVENSGYGVQLIQVSASSSCRISVLDPENGIRYNENSGLKTWKVTAYNNKFPDGDFEAYNIYARLERSGTAALVVYDKKVRAVSGGIITTGTAEDGSTVTETGEADPDYWYIRIGTVGATDGVSVIREITYDTGKLNTPEANLAAGEILASMFVPHYDDPDNPDVLTWIEAKSHMGVSGGVTMFIQDQWTDLPQIVEAIPFDNKTIWLNEETGVVEVIGGTGGGGSVEYPLLWTGFSSGTWNGTAEKTIEIPSTFSQLKGNVTNDMLQYSSVIIAGNEVSLGGAITASTLIESLKGIHSSGWTNTEPYVYNESDGSIDYYWVKIANISTTTNGGYSIVDISVMTDNNYSSGGSYRLYLSSYRDSVSFALTQIGTRIGDPYLMAVLDTSCNVWVKAQNAQWSSTLRWREIVSGNAATIYTDSVEKIIENPSNCGEVVSHSGGYTLYVTDAGFSNLYKIGIYGDLITYDPTNGYFKLAGDLLVTGGISMFSSDTNFTPSTVMDGVLVDEETIGKNEDGQLYVKSVGGAKVVIDTEMPDLPENNTLYVITG